MRRWNEEDEKRLDGKGVLEGHGLEHDPVDNDDWDDWDDEDDITECARVPAPNPWTDGIWVSSQPDMSPKGFTPDELNDVYWELSRGDGLDKLMEAASFEEFDSWYNPGTEDIDPAFITEAIVIKKFARTEAVMRRGLVKSLRRFLDAKDPVTGTPIELLDPIVGRPRKSGMFAYVTVQLPFSDGQVVSILFHAPEGDGKRITPQDTIVAFRWMLNKRDITNIVAPEDGKEVSIATIGRRLSLLVEKNAPRFANTQKEAQAEKRELAKVTDRVKELREEIDKVSDAIAKESLDLETATAENGNTKALVERQKTTNAELRARLEALQKLDAERDKVEADKEPGETDVETETGENGVGGAGVGVEELHKGVSANVMQVLQGAETRFKRLNTLVAPSWPDWKVGQNVLLWGPAFNNASSGKAYSLIDFHDENAAEVLQFRLNVDGSFIAIPAKDDEEFFKLCLVKSRSENEHRFYLDAKNVFYAVLSGWKDKKDQQKLIEKYESNEISWTNYREAIACWQLAQRLSLEELVKEALKDDWDRLMANTTTEEPTTENPVPDDPTVTAETVETEEPEPSTEEPDTTEPEEPSTEEPSANTPAFVADLNDILAGKYDGDFAKLEEVLGVAIEAIENGGEEMEQYYQLAEQASDRYTDLIDKDGDTEAA